MSTSWYGAQLQKETAKRFNDYITSTQPGLYDIGLHSPRINTSLCILLVTQKGLTWLHVSSQTSTRQTQKLKSRYQKQNQTQSYTSVYTYKRYTEKSRDKPWLSIELQHLQGATFKKAKLVYTAVVRSAITYAAPIQFSLAGAGAGATTNNLIDKLNKIQNQCLRTIAGAYIVTPISLLGLETDTPL